MRVDALLKPLLPWPAPARVLAFLMVLALLWAPLAIPLSLLIPDPDRQSIITLLVLYCEFIWLLRRWGRVSLRLQRPLVYYGLLRSHNLSLIALGLFSGALLVFAMFGLEMLLGWANWLGPDIRFPLTALEGILVGLGIGFAEELLFRGWILDELAQNYHWNQALWGSAMIFAVLHFLKPLGEILQSWPQFLGLVLLGLIMGLAKQLCQRRLGLAMGLHGGLVGSYYWINVGELVGLTKQVPDWVTGVNQNPLAGVVGLVFLSGMAIALQTTLRWVNPPAHL